MSAWVPAIRLSGSNAYIGIDDTVTLSSGTDRLRRPEAAGIPHRNRGRLSGRSSLTISIGAMLPGGNADIGGSRFHGKPLCSTNQGMISADMNGQSLSLGNGHLANFHNKGTVQRPTAGRSGSKPRSSPTTPATRARSPEAPGGVTTVQSS